MATPTGVSILSVRIASALLLALAASQPATASGERKVPASQAPAAPRLHPVTGAKLFALHPGLEIDPAAGELYLESKVCLDSGILEFLVVQGEAKAYESALSTTASPSQLMAGMLLLKWKPGDELSILALRGKDTIPLEKLLHARNPAPKPKAKAKPGLRWLLTGSNHAEMEKSPGGFWADREGIHVALVERTESLVQLQGDLKNPYHNSAFGYEIRPGTSGGKGQAVTLIFRKAGPKAG